MTGTKRTFISVLLVLTFTVILPLNLFAAGSKEPAENSTAETQSPSSGEQQAAGSQAPAATANTAPWYAARLEAEGFSVINPPKALPPFTVDTLDGKTASLQNVLGKVVVLNFWATWCPPCRMEMPSFEILHKELQGLPFTFFAISVGERKDTVTNFLKDNPYTFPIYLNSDGRLGQMFASRGIPTTYILNKQGQAIAGIIGAHMYDTPEMIQLMRDLAEKL
ncbi:MAG: TlpA family protein disulfide reductase [Spirochaetes bacterium]|nr:TlpA family protein disulfide reductase [Spirochaetota bacterium]MBU0955520.1 TlpA family protein disulfide reductase [Spirochaetota bacterium]